TGLTSSDARARIGIHGMNELPLEPKKSPFITLLEEFKDPLLIILIIAAIISFLVHQGEHSYEAYIILLIVGLNAFFSFYQKNKADRAIEALRNITSHDSVVIRDGKQERVNANELVPGDLIILNEGDRVPADARLVVSKDLATSEAALTGESMPVSKHVETINDPDCPLADRRNMVYGSTLVTRGKGRAIVIATGTSTEIGKISLLIAGTDIQKTPLQKNLEDFALKLGKLIMVICVAIFLLNGPVRHPDNYLVWLEQFLAAIAMAVAAIPEGLPLVITSTLAIGVGRIAKKKAIIKKMHAIESLGCTTTICTDKTGTLTRNEMTVVKLWAGGRLFDVDGTGYRPEGAIFLDTGSIDELTPGVRDDLVRLLETGCLCNDAKLVYKEQERAWDIIGDPTEACLLVAARKAKIDPEALARVTPRVDELPFDSTRKRMTTVHRSTVDGITPVAHVKGAMESILELCTRIQDQGAVRDMTEADKQSIRNVHRTNASRALRGLAFATRDLDPRAPIKVETVECDLVFRGMQFMIDPPRDEVAFAIAKCKTAGINVKMITGDNAITARAIAEQLGIIHGSDAHLLYDRSIDHDAAVEPVAELQDAGGPSRRGHRGLYRRHVVFKNRPSKF
nr:HAD-IC family P-type ATPase [Candidatus Sigynarchaeota archaeon]